MTFRVYSMILSILSLQRFWQTSLASVPAAMRHVSSTIVESRRTITEDALFAGQKLSALLQIRGGAVHEPETLDDVDAILLKAASEEKLVVIDFSATWCGPCKMIAPLFKELSEGMPDVVFVKIDVDENTDTAAKYNVSAMPTFVFVKSGEVVDRLSGANPARLQELIDEHK